MNLDDVQWIVTCEHGGAKVPAELRSQMASARRWLSTHAAYDLGALPLAKSLALKLSASLHQSQVTRLVVDLNRNAECGQPFSVFSRDWDKATQARVLQSYYWPYRRSVERDIQKRLRTKTPVVLLSVHSFTPSLQGVRRPTEIGLLYDPDRWRESLWVRWLQKNLRSTTSWEVHRNRPYRGWTDAFVNDLNAQFPDERFLSICLEVRSDHLRTARHVRLVCADLLSALLEAPHPFVSK